jgi:protein-disulfide isomerase
MSVTRSIAEPLRTFVRKATIIGMVTAISMVAATAYSNESPMDDERIKSLVKEVIRENPKLIIDTLNRYQAERKKKKQEQEFEASFKNRLTDTIADHNPSKGPVDALVTIIEYTDFQCPYCARGAQTLNQVQQQYSDKVRVVFKNLPLKMHAQAEPAARAALAANKQGKFWEYHDLLFQQASSLNDDIYINLAADLGLDVEQFANDMNSETVAAQVRSDMNQARALRLNGTPRFLVNGVQIKGAYPPDYFVKVINRLLKEKSES